MAKDKKSKIPFKVLTKKGLMGLAMAGVMVASPFMLAGCSNGQDGKDGAPGAPGTIWKSGTSYTEFTDAKVGDYFIDTDDYILYQKTADSWITVMENYGKPAVAPVITIENGYWKIDGVVTEFVAEATDGKTPYIEENGYWYIDGEPTGVKAQGQTGSTGKSAFELYKEANPGFDGTLQDWFDSLKGDPGKDGISCYLGYDGYYWNGTERTEYSANASLNDGVVENTIGIEGVMSKYFAGSYIDLSSNSIALMSNYMANINMTRYSDSKVYEIKVITEEAGKLYVGKAKVADVVSARTLGNNYATNMQEYDVVAGLNTIALNLHIAEDETIVLGGQGSVGLYMTSGIPVNDESGNFTLINNQTHTDIISNDGTYADTLAVQVKANFASAETELTPDAQDFIRTTELADTVANQTENAIIFTNNYFKNSQITNIGLPIKTAKTIGKNSENEATFTISIIKYKQTPIQVCKSFTINIPYEKLKDVAVYNATNQNYDINKWVHVDVSALNIILEEDETLGFLGNSSDTIVTGFEKTEETTSTHGFAYTLANAPDWNKAATKNHVAFDVYGKKFGITLEEQIQKLENKNSETILANALQGKNISILGDSASSYVGWSNNTQHNSTLESNGTTAFDGTRHGVANVDQMWWKQTIDKTGMNLLVDNAKSGAQINAETLQRAQQLHCDVGDNSGTNPDIIAVWIGINDVRYGSTVSDFEQNYRNMIQTITTKYNAADVYVFTLIPQQGHDKATDAMVKQVNAKITAIAEEFECNVVDLYNDTGININNSGTYMYDYLHANYKGMTLVAQCFMDVLYENYVTNVD